MISISRSALLPAARVQAHLRQGARLLHILGRNGHVRRRGIRVQVNQKKSKKTFSKIKIKIKSPPLKGAMRDGASSKQSTRDDTKKSFTIKSISFLLLFKKMIDFVWEFSPAIFPLQAERPRLRNPQRPPRPPAAALGQQPHEGHLPRVRRIQRAGKSHNNCGFSLKKYSKCEVVNLETKTQNENRLIIACIVFLKKR